MLNSTFVSYLFCRQSHGDTVQPILCAFLLPPAKRIMRSVLFVRSFIYLFIRCFVHKISQKMRTDWDKIISVSCIRKD